MQRGIGHRAEGEVHRQFRVEAHLRRAVQKLLVMKWETVALWIDK
jgi:hypothetical protein